MAGYKQQDAHEFFIATLNLLHTHFRDSSKAQQTDPCNCIVDEIFTGTLLSDLVCTTCKHVSPTLEPFKDLSLDLSFDMNGQPKSLLNCLERFTRLEHLGANAKLICSKCNTEQEFTKVRNYFVKRFSINNFYSPRNWKFRLCLSLQASIWKDSNKLDWWVELILISHKLSKFHFFVDLEWQEENQHFYFVSNGTWFNTFLSEISWEPNDESSICKIFSLCCCKPWR